MKIETIRRITSIDALRALTLLGIITEHAFDGFGRGVLEPAVGIDEHLAWFISTFVYGRSYTIFCVLFGVSFCLILQNPQNTSMKFLWRCFLLLLIGLAAKLLFTYDALMWFGLCGMVLVPVRYMKPRYILSLFLLLVLATAELHKLKLGNQLFGAGGTNRYMAERFSDIVSYPYAVQDYLRVIFNRGIFGPFALFVLGYWLAVKGFIQRLEEVVTGKALLMCWGIYLVSFALLETGVLRSLMFLINKYASTFAYASTVIYVYYHSPAAQSWLRLLEPYGRMGLTNYSMQGIMGVCLIWQFTRGALPYSLWGVVLLCWGIFVVQAVVSYVWLQHFRYGPMEYAWRAATERRLIKMRR